VGLFRESSAAEPASPARPFLGGHGPGLQILGPVSTAIQRSLDEWPPKVEREPLARRYRRSKNQEIKPGLGKNLARGRETVLPAPGPAPPSARSR